MSTPKRPTGKKGQMCIDWDELAKRVRCKSTKVMLERLYGYTEEELRSGKMSAYKLAKYLKVGIQPLKKLLKEHGYPVSSRSDRVKFVVRPRKKVFYPYRKLGFKIEYDMWKYFIENNITIKEIINRMYEVSGKYFVYKTVHQHFHRAKRDYKKRAAENKT
jgi:hypothetical protein